MMTEKIRGWEPSPEDWMDWGYQLKLADDITLTVAIDPHTKPPNQTMWGVHDTCSDFFIVGHACSREQGMRRAEYVFANYIEPDGEGHYRIKKGYSRQQVVEAAEQVM